MKKYGTGRRKTAAAREFMKPGNGCMQVNNHPLDQYFSRETARMIVRQPLEVVELTDKFDLKITVRGGGNSAPAPDPLDYERSVARRLESLGVERPDPERPFPQINDMARRQVPGRAALKEKFGLAGLQGDGNNSTLALERAATPQHDHPAGEEVQPGETESAEVPDRLDHPSRFPDSRQTTHLR